MLVLLDTFVFVPVHYSTSYEKFYAEEPNSLDLVSIGNSTVRNGIIPSKIWNDYGLTSFNICSGPTHLEVIIIAINEVARLQKPQVVYVDLNGLTFQTRDTQNQFVINYVNDMPDCEQKQKLIEEYDYLKDGLKHQDEFELFKNHNNFRNLEYYEIHLNPIYNENKDAYLKGWVPFKNSTRQQPFELDKTTVLNLSADGEYYLNRILNTCKQYPDIQFVFGKMPRILNNNIVNETYILRSAIPAIEQAGYKYIEWEDFIEQIGLDGDSDFVDEHHLNMYGAEKFTKYYTEYLINNFSLCVREKSEKTINSFDASYNLYKNLIV